MWHNAMKTIPVIAYIKLLKCQSVAKILIQLEKGITFTGTSVRPTYDLSTEAKEVRRQWNSIFNMKKEKLQKSIPGENKFEKLA